MGLKMLLRNKFAKLEWLAAVLFGSCASVALVNYLRPWTSRLTQIMFFILLASAIATVYYKFIFPRFLIAIKVENKNVVALCLFLGVLSASFLISIIGIPFPLDKRAVQVLKIIPLVTSSGNKNITLVEVKINEKKIPLKRFSLGRGWEIQNEMLVYSGETQEGITYSFRNRPQSQIVMLFQEGSQMGNASIIVNGLEQERINLFGNTSGEQLLNVVVSGIVDPPWLLVLIYLACGIALLPFTSILSLFFLRLLLAVFIFHSSKSMTVSPLSKKWTFFMGIEFLLVGIILAGNSLFKLEVYTDYTLGVKAMQVNPLLFIGGAFLFLAGVMLLLLPEVNDFFRYNRFFIYFIPTYHWVLLVLFSMEIILRVAVTSYPFGYVNTNWFGDVPAKGSSTLLATEGYAVTHYYGPPSREIHTPFDDGDNILLLGDSFTEGAQVPDEQKFASVAEIALRRDGYRVNLRNLGKGSYDVADYVYLIPKYIELYHPTAIVIQLSELDFIESISVGYTNHYFIVENSKIIDVLNMNRLNDDNYEAGSVIHIYTVPMLLAKGRTRFVQMKTQPPVSAPETFNTDLAEQQMSLLLEVCNEIPLFLIMTPHAPYTAENGVVMDDPLYANLETFLANYSSITVVDPLPEFQYLTASSILPSDLSSSTSLGGGHFNRRGNEILGKLLAKAIEKVLK